MTKGLPASGKTTWARTQNMKRVNKDDLRQMIDNGVWSKKNERLIVDARNWIVHGLLQNGEDVIVDDTNLAPVHGRELRKIAGMYSAEFEIKDFTDVPLEECIKRDQNRPNYVGEKVIRRMHNHFLKPKPPVLEYDPKLPDAIICDLDGTLALFGDANPYDRDFSQDKLNPAIFSLIEWLGWSNNIIRNFKDDVSIIITSGRNDKFKQVTEKWLHGNTVFPDLLFMRKDGDTRKDSIIKKEMYENNIKGKYNVLFVLDDRNQVVDMWRSLGLPCFQVNEGDF